MKKYIISVTNQSHLYDVAERLFDDNIAAPVMWIGDDRLYGLAKKKFGNIVFNDLIHRHRNYDIKEITYEKEHLEFFKSENYLRAKDISLKMMDRLDLYGSFSRIDREVYFHKLLLLYLKTIKENQPEFLICAEAPHAYTQYTIYEICKFLNIPSYKLSNWSLGPILMLQNLNNDKFIKVDESNFGKYNMLVDKKINDFIERVLKNSRYELQYMKKNRNSNSLLNRIKVLFLNDLKKIYLDFRHNIGMIIKQKYNPINPYRFGIIYRYYILDKRKKNLYNAFIKHSINVDLNCEYVYFPLHFEPERTTNPDGGIFHDQFLALKDLRNILPGNIKIYVKEHPSQFYISDRGSRGRSPLFYNLINNVKNTFLVRNDYNTIDLIKRSKFVATITGTVAIEAAILGIPALTFGSVWYKGCPNIIPFKDGLSYKEVINLNILKPHEITKFFEIHKKTYAFLGFQNQSQRNRHSEFDEKEFLDIQSKSLFKILVKLFQNKNL